MERRPSLLLERRPFGLVMQSDDTDVDSSPQASCFREDLRSLLFDRTFELFFATFASLGTSLEISV